MVTKSFPIPLITSNVACLKIYLDTLSPNSVSVKQKVAIQVIVSQKLAIQVMNKIRLWVYSLFQRYTDIYFLHIASEL